jgi:hypothetical protein
VTDSSNPRRSAAYFAWKRALWSDDVLRKHTGKSTSARDLRVTACCLADVFGTWGRNMRPAIATLAAMTGYSPNTVRRHLQSLVTMGWLTTLARPGKATVYAISNPSHHSDMGTPPTMMGGDLVKPSNEKGFALPRDVSLTRYHNEHPDHPVIETAAGTVACYRCGVTWNPAP